jgi:Protein of unknown function (DUF2946)
MLYYNIGTAEIPWQLRCGVNIGVKWFRSNIRHGSRLALFALAIQFALSFGHFHEAARAAAIQSGLSQPAASGVAAADTTDRSAQQQQPSRDSDRRSNDGCAICAVIAMANAVLFATPPLLQLPQAVEFLYQTTNAGFVHLHAAHVAFQPRAPPIS